MAVSALVRNAVNIVGNGRKTLVFGHGLGTDQRSFARMIDHFRHDYRVVSFDLTGAGQSLQQLYNPSKYATLHGHANDLVQICDDLGLEGAFYVGHSAGGMIGALASIAAPRIFYKMVMIGASPHYINEEGYIGGSDRKDIDAMIAAISADYVAWCEQVVPMALAEPASSQLARDLARQFRQLNPRIAEHLAGVMLYSDHRHELSGLATNCLVIQPEIDPFVPVVVGQFIVDHVQRGRMIVVRARGGHFPHLGAPAEIHALIDKFFRDGTQVVA